MSPIARRGVLIVVALGVGLAGVAAAEGWLELRRPFAGWAGDHVDIVLEPGLSARSMIRALAREGVVRRPRLLRWWLALNDGADDLQAGEYRFADPNSALGVIERLRAGDVLLHPITVPEGLSVEEVARRVAASGLGDVDELRTAFADPSPVRDLDPQAGDLEGYLFPETYRFPRGTGAARIAATMVRRFREVVGPDYVERAEQAGLTLREAVILASMIEKETSVAQERARISRVFHNRLARGMKLQCDPTVIYALRRADRQVERLTKQDLQFDSPWNTYVVPGLPRGPIGNPGQASLTAVVEPAAGNDLYFVAAPGGGHRFSPSLEAHLEAVAEWRRYSRSSR